MAVSCGQRNNRPRGEAHFQLLFHSPFCSEQPLQTHRPLSNKSDLPREAVKQRNYSLHRLVFLAADNEQRSEVNWFEPHGWNRPQIDRASAILPLTGVICVALAAHFLFLSHHVSPWLQRWWLMKCLISYRFIQFLFEIIAVFYPN